MSLVYLTQREIKSIYGEFLIDVFTHKAAYFNFAASVFFTFLIGYMVFEECKDTHELYHRERLLPSFFTGSFMKCGKEAFLEKSWKRLGT